MCRPDQFLQTIYLGDRACKGYAVDSWEQSFSLLVDNISRIRDPDGIWRFDSSHDIPSGRLVFENVTALAFTPAGPLPNDYILGISVEPAENSYLFVIKVASVESGSGESCEVVISVTASGLYLEDPRRPGEQIRE